ncbi:hypothetical protein WJ438_22150 [Streptomyces sp. GD-15H]
MGCHVESLADKLIDPADLNGAPVALSFEDDFHRAAGHLACGEDIDLPATSTEYSGDVHVALYARVAQPGYGAFDLLLELAPELLAR